MFSDLESIHSYLEENALNYKHFHQISDIFINFRDHIHNETNSNEVEKAQWEINLFNFIVKDGSLNPRFTTTNEKGDILEFPSLNLFNEEALDYFIERLNSTNNPLLKTLYAVLLWNSPLKHAKYAIIAIDSYLDLIKIYEEKDKIKPMEHCGLNILDSIKNAYFLSRQINVKTEDVKSEIKRLIFDFNLNSNTSFALRANLIELMLKQKRIFLKEDFEAIGNICF